MNVYVIYDRRTGDILHKHRLWRVGTDPKLGTSECSEEEVLRRYRGSVPRNQLRVALIRDYTPQSSRGRSSRYNEATGEIETVENGPPATSKEQAKLRRLKRR